MYFIALIELCDVNWIMWCKLFSSNLLCDYGFLIDYTELCRGVTCVISHFMYKKTKTKKRHKKKGEGKISGKAPPTPPFHLFWLPCSLSPQNPKSSSTMRRRERATGPEVLSASSTATATAGPTRNPCRPRRSIEKERGKGEPATCGGLSYGRRPTDYGQGGFRTVTEAAGKQKEEDLNGSQQGTRYPSFDPTQISPV